MLLPLGFASCEKPQLHYAELEAYYAESQNLDAAARISVYLTGLSKKMRFTTFPFLSRNSTEIMFSGFNIQNVA